MELEDKLIGVGSAVPDGKPPEALFADAMRSLARRDVQTSRRLMREAAGQGFLAAIVQYALFVEYGVGGKPAPGKALVWLEKAAALGEATACMRLADRCLARGDVGRAKFWLMKSEPNARAMLMAAGLYARSRSVRATRRAKRLIGLIWRNESMLTAKEKAEFDALKIAFWKRNPDPMFSKRNQRVNALLPKAYSDWPFPSS